MQTEDLFLGALGLARGGELDGIDVRRVNGRAMAIFRITGPSMAEVEREYYHGRVLVNLRMLKAEVARLKNAAFDALRKEESRDEARTSRGRF
jgi:predicted transcriptional regulator